MSDQKSGLPPRAHLIVILTIALSAAVVTVFCIHYAHRGIGSLWLLAVFTVFILASWLWPIVMYQGESSQAHHLDEGIFVILALTMNPIGVVIAFGIATVLAQAIRHRPFVKSSFNVAQILLASTAGVGIMHLVDPPSQHLTLEQLGVGILGALVYFLVNSTAVASVLAAIGAVQLRESLIDGLEIRALLVAASVALGLVCALAVSSYSMAAIFCAFPFWAFRQTLAGHFRARHDRTRLRGLFDATLDVNRTMGEKEVIASLAAATSDLLRSPEVRVIDHRANDDEMAAEMAVQGRSRWLVISGRSRAEPFDDADRALLNALAAVGSVALENASLYQERQHQQENLAALTSSLGEGVCAFDGNGHVTFLNPASADLLGLNAAEVLRHGEVVPAELELLWNAARESIEIGATIKSQRGVSFKRSGGDEFHVEYTCSPIRSTEGVNGVVIAFRDISENIAFEEQLAFQAFHDSLTGLPNRRLFLDRLQHALDRRGREGEVHALLFVDIDRFKLANDSLGHQAGDQVLISLADYLRQVVREGDTLARFGGDEFTLLLEDIGSSKNAEEVARAVLDLVRTPIPVMNDKTVIASVSIGIAIAHHGMASDDVLHDADVAMYEAKHRGSGQFAVYDSAEMHSRSAEQIDLDVQLRLALERDELTVYYQPLFSTQGRGIVGAEALVRWNHPERGLLLPSHFIRLAEDTGLIFELGRKVLDEASRQAMIWSDSLGTPFNMAVNLSARQFQAEDLVNEIQSVLTRSGIAPSQLCLEITESLAHFDIERSISILTHLKSIGVALAIDDFGTGYSSLNYLKRFPVNMVKIDGSFIQDLGESVMDTAIVAAVVELARITGMTAVAEGVETKDQLERLMQMGCPFVQGYFLARPMPAEDLSELLLSNARHPDPFLREFVGDLQVKDASSA